MVTIEQKLLLFSKLLNQSMNQSFEEELKELEKQYKEKLQKTKEEVDLEANKIVEKENKNFELKKNQIISKSKIKLKRETMLLKEKYYNQFLNSLKVKLNFFVNSKEYKNYLANNLKKLDNELFNNYSNLVIYLTKIDYDKYSEFIKENIEEKFNVTCIFNCLDTLIGGLIIENTEKNYRVDLSIDSILEENKLYIMQELFNALGTGDIND
ncbi:MAG: V-type ATP synthase subunit E [Tissierellia bacterium]|nr:V-type ATP synthase subunit E [Tissierellia bacterium]